MAKTFRGNERITFLRVSCAFFSLIFLVRLFYIQVVKNKDFLLKASDQHNFLTIIQARRGDILSSDGYPLATSKVTYNLFAEPKKIINSAETSRILSEIIFSDYKESSRSERILGNVDDSDKLKILELDLFKKLTQDLYWVKLASGLSEKTKEIINSRKMKGLNFEDKVVRFYPEKTLASHILGFVAGSDNTEDRGYFGLEGYFDNDLKGRSGKIVEEKGASGSPILFGGYRKIVPNDGKNIEITLDRKIQFMVERKLKEGVEKYGAEKGSVVVVNPYTGDIISLANFPTFDPEKYYEEPDEKNNIKISKINYVISDIYEPGSIMKPLTVASAIDLKLVTPETTFNDNGVLFFSGYKIDNWNGKHLGIQNIYELLEKSNNIGAATVGVKVGRENLYNYFKKFGIGSLTGISLEGEETGNLRNYKDWEDIDLATASFGQGISATVLQMAMAFSVFDNGGVLVKPRIVSKIFDDRRTIEIPSEQKRRVISLETAKTMNKLLISAVEKGESKYFNLKEYTIAGKTGTAQIPVDGKYDANKTNATFVGFLPNAQTSKKFVMVVRLDKPTTSVYAAETAVPLWMSILKELVIIYNIPPDKF